MRNSLRQNIALNRLIGDSFCENNDWVQPFYAARTFEVEFLLSNNRQEVEAALDEIYTTPGPKAASKTRLADQDERAAGKEVLRLANKCGKGWFALLLSEKLRGDTFVPDYILRAIAFACYESVNDKSLKRIGEFRRRCDPAPYTLGGFTLATRAADDMCVEWVETITCVFAVGRFENSVF